MVVESVAMPVFDTPEPPPQEVIKRASKDAVTGVRINLMRDTDNMFPLIIERIN
jgi:hypothetical protein